MKSATTATFYLKWHFCKNVNKNGFMEFRCFIDLNDSNKYCYNISISLNMFTNKCCLHIDYRCRCRLLSIYLLFFLVLFARKIHNPFAEFKPKFINHSGYDEWNVVIFRIWITYYVWQLSVQSRLRGWVWSLEVSYKSTHIRIRIYDCDTLYDFNGKQALFHCWQ